MLKNFVLNFIKKQEHLAFVLGEQHDAIEFFYHFVYEIRNTCSEILEFKNMNENEANSSKHVFKVTPNIVMFWLNLSIFKNLIVPIDAHKPKEYVRIWL